MKKGSYEHALTIIEPKPKRLNSGGVPVRKYYTSKIDGKKISRSSKWWGVEWHEVQYGVKGHRCMVTSRLKHGWQSEENACLARKGESEADYIKRTTKQPILKGVKPDQVVSVFLSRRWA